MLSPSSIACSLSPSRWRSMPCPFRTWTEQKNVLFTSVRKKKWVFSAACSPGFYLRSQFSIGINSFSEQLHLRLPLQHKNNTCFNDKLQWSCHHWRWNKWDWFLTDMEGSSKARINLSVWFVGERINSVLPPWNILWEAISQVGTTSLCTLLGKVTSPILLGTVPLQLQTNVQKTERWHEICFSLFCIIWCIFLVILCIFLVVLSFVFRVF